MIRFSIILSLFFCSCGVLLKGTSYFGEKRVFGKGGDAGNSIGSGGDGGYFKRNITTMASGVSSRGSDG